MDQVDATQQAMQQAVDLAAAVRGTTGSNPWVGCVLVAADGTIFGGATQPPGHEHAEVRALQAMEAAGVGARGATAYVTLEPCAHTGRTGPCADALIDAGVARVVVALEDPDENVSGAGIARLRGAGIEVEVGCRADDVRAQLAPYLKHRSTGRPWVVLKLAATLDGRTAAPDGTSQWITGGAARADVHELRAISDAIVVGAGTVRADDPSLTVRHVEGRDPIRVVLGTIPAGAKVLPAMEFRGALEDLLDELGGRGILQVMVEGGATVAGAFHRSGLVDQYVVYLAPALLGGEDGRPIFGGAGVETMADIWRGHITGVRQLGADLRIDLVSAAPSPTTGQVPMVLASPVPISPVLANPIPPNPIPTNLPPSGTVEA